MSKLLSSLFKKERPRANRSFAHKNERFARKNDERIPNPGVGVVLDFLDDRKNYFTFENKKVMIKVSKQFI